VAAPAMAISASVSRPGARMGVSRVAPGNSQTDLDGLDGLDVDAGPGVGEVGIGDDHEVPSGRGPFRCRGAWARRVLEAAASRSATMATAWMKRSAPAAGRVLRSPASSPGVESGCLAVRGVRSRRNPRSNEFSRLTLRAIR
jgi:hypothetical protein